MLVFYSKGVAMENLGEGRNPQNLRSRAGFCKELKVWGGVWGAAPAKFSISMLFFPFLHNFLSIFVILNHIFLIIFFVYFRISFGLRALT